MQQKLWSEFNITCAIYSKFGYVQTWPHMVFCCFYYLKYIWLLFGIFRNTINYILLLQLQSQYGLFLQIMPTKFSLVFFTNTSLSNWMSQIQYPISSVSAKFVNGINLLDLTQLQCRLLIIVYYTNILQMEVGRYIIRTISLICYLNIKLT